MTPQLPFILGGIVAIVVWCVGTAALDHYRANRRRQPGAWHRGRA